LKREPLDHTCVLNSVGKYLTRRPDAPLSDCVEPWRFPLIDSYRAGQDVATEYWLNRITFVWRAASKDDTKAVSVVGSFDNLWDATSLEPVLFDGQSTLYRAATVLVPKGQVHFYKFLEDGRPALDPINPQRTVLDNGNEWSRFFTQQCAIPVSFETWELAILARLTNEILPFTSQDAQHFMDLYYFTADRQARETVLHQAFRLEQPIGAVNFIDKLVAREERHRLIDYKLCLSLIDGVLRNRFPGLTPAEVSKDAYQNLYQQMAADTVDGWDKTRYGSPNYFLQLLRRHTYAGAFSHPKYGGNAAAAGWAWLEDRFRGPNDVSCFDWRRSIEQPLGASADYFA
jgi:gluconate 2-dehydrogenase subunit 3-like protein